MEYNVFEILESGTIESTNHSIWCSENDYQRDLIDWLQYQSTSKKFICLPIYYGGIQ
jgi:hypothetical protein